MTIQGIGIDIVNIKRIKNMSLKFKDRFKKRIFTKNEIAYAESFANPYGHYAMRFAAKEAFLKSIGGIKNFDFRSVELISDGKPRLHLLGDLGKRFDEKQFFVSLSDEKESAIAIVVWSCL